MWFRLHTHLLHNAKAQSLSGHLFKAWINLLCIAKEGDGTIPCVLQVAFHLRMKVLQAQRVLDELEQLNLLSSNPDGTYGPKDWNEHQYKSDVSSDRVKQFRERQRNVSRNGIETPSDTETEAESETEEEKPVAARKPRAATATMGTRFALEALPGEWAQFALTDCGMDLQAATREFQKFRDYWIAATGSKARKADWFATWRNWCRNVKSRDGPKSGAFNFQPHESHTDRAIRIGNERILETGRL